MHDDARCRGRHKRRSCKPHRSLQRRVRPPKEQCHDAKKKNRSDHELSTAGIFILGSGRRRIEGHPVATYDLVGFLVDIAGVKGPLLRELAGNSTAFRDIAMRERSNALVGDGLAPEMVWFADGRPPEEYTIDHKARYYGVSSEALLAFREGITAAPA